MAIISRDGLNQSKLVVLIIEIDLASSCSSPRLILHHHVSLNPHHE
jgi:hypothetical protein